MSETVHIHLEIPQDLVGQFPEGELTCRLVRAEDGTAEICVTSTRPLADDDLVGPGSTFTGHKDAE